MTGSLDFNIWPAGKWSGEKSGASKSSSSTRNHTRSHTLYLTVTGMWESSPKNKEEEVDSLWTLRYWSPLTCFLSFCAGGSKALERSAIFCQRRGGKNDINMQIEPDVWQQLSKKKKKKKFSGFFIHWFMFSLHEWAAHVLQVIILTINFIDHKLLWWHLF